MVFFTCNACGSSVKKNQVEKHYQNECRSCSVLSCMDCGQEFYGDDYASHTQCISEAEKYQGSMFKGTGNKGDKKQQEWLEKARVAMQSAKVKPKLKSLLEKVSEYPNIPRKKSKFENFVRNSCNVRDPRTLEELWEVFNQSPQPVACATSMNIVDSQEGEKLEKEAGHDVNNGSLSKKKNKIQVEKQSETEMEVECHGNVKKKTKKKTVEEDADSDGPVKKRKKQAEMTTEEDVDDNGPVKKKTKKKTVEEEADSEGPAKKRTKHAESVTVKEVDANGPVKKGGKRTVEEEVDNNGPVKKKKKKTEMRTVEEDMNCDGPRKKKTKMSQVEEEMENTAYKQGGERKKREALTIPESVFDEKKLVVEEKVKGLESMDECHQVLVGSKERKRKSGGSKN